MEIRRARPEDAVLTSIAFAAKRHWGYPERWIESWRPQLTITATYIADHEVHFAIENGQPVGFYALVIHQIRLELQHLWVLPERMGQGIGRLLFTHALRRARHLGFSELEIESDPNAGGFYERMGARQIGSRVFELDEQRRELPIFLCAVAGAC